MGSRKMGGTLDCHTWGTQIKKFEIDGSGEQLMGEMSAIVGRLLLEMVGDTMAKVGAKDFEAFCATLERAGKTIMANALADASSRWAKEHGIPVREEEIFTRYCEIF